MNDLPAQRISVEGMQGFGISISKGVDIDLNSCNGKLSLEFVNPDVTFHNCDVIDIVIGAHDSGNAALLRCHPSTSVFPSLDTYPAELSINDTEFTTQICVKFQGTYYNTGSCNYLIIYIIFVRIQYNIWFVISELEFKVYPDKEYGRVTFNNKEDSRFTMSGSHGLEECKDILLNINVSDLITYIANGFMVFEQ